MVKKLTFLMIVPLFLKAMSLGELIDLSLLNEDYLIQELNTQKILNEQKSAQRAYLPSLSIQGGYVANNKDVFITDPKESLYAKLSLNLLLYDGGKREAVLSSLEHQNTLAHASKEYTKNTLELRATTLFFNYKSMQSLIEASEQKVLYLQNMLDLVQKFYETGLKSKDEYESMKAQFHLAQLELSKNKLKIFEIQKELKKLIKSDFKALESELKAHLKEPNFNLKSYNQELAMSNIQVALAKESVDIAKSEYLPRVYIQNNYGFYKTHFDLDPSYKSMPGIEGLLDNAFPKRSQTNQFILGFEWKIFDFNARVKKVEAQRLDLQIKRLENEYKKRANELELSYIKDELEVLKEQIYALELSLNASELAFKSVDTQYKAGLKSYTEYLQGLESLFKTRADLELVKNEFEIAKARYYFNAGVNIKERIAS